MYASNKMPTMFRKKLIVMTKFPDISLTLVKWLKFPDIFSKFPDNSLTWRKFCFSLTFPWHVATLLKHDSALDRNEILMKMVWALERAFNFHET